MKEYSCFFVWVEIVTSNKTKKCHNLVCNKTKVMDELKAIRITGCINS